MILTLLSAAVLLKPGISLQINLERTDFQVGEPVKYTVHLKNLGKQPITVAVAMHDGALAASAYTSLQLGKTTLVAERESSQFQGQVMVSREVQADRFLVLNGGETYSILEETIKGKWNLTGPPGLKASYEGASVVPLEPGPYTLTATYQFPKGSILGLVKESDLTFGPNAKKFYRAAFRGEVKGTAKFVVRR